MSITGWIVVALAVIVAGWMTYDGARALTVGDYVTPKSGQYAGQLGPWSKVVSAVGIAPRSTAMKLIFTIYGALWLAVIVCFVIGLKWSWWAMLIFALGSLWYLPFGTLLGLIQAGLLLAPWLRGR
ncbi:MAG: hypothetical protein ACE5GA_08800 [Candidatus Zixiibacteriota bacterium]